MQRRKFIAFLATCFPLLGSAAAATRAAGRDLPAYKLSQFERSDCSFVQEMRREMARLGETEGNFTCPLCSQKICIEASASDLAA